MEAAGLSHLATLCGDYCGKCPEFPCAKLSEFCPDDREGCPPGFHIENLRRRMAIGAEEWIAEQRKIWGK